MPDRISLASIAGITQHADAGIHGRELVCKMRGRVGGTVIDHQNLAEGPGAGIEELFHFTKCFRKPGRLVIGGNHNGNGTIQKGWAAVVEWFVD